MMTKETACSAAATTVQRMAHDLLDEYDLEILSDKRSTSTSQQDHVRTAMEYLLLDYGRNEGHIYKLGIVCGMRTFRYGPTTCTHVNFLASTADVPDNSTRSWALFFAEFGNIDDPTMNVPFCCPVGDSLDAYSTRCYVCDNKSCRIAYPSSDEHVYYTGNTQPGFPVPYQWGADLHGMLESDFLYFEDENGEFAKILSEEPSSSPRKKPRTREELSSLFQTNTRARTFAGHNPGPICYY